MQNILHRVSEFISTATPKRTATLLVIALIALAIPLTVVTLQKSTENRQNAATPICSAGDEVCVANIIYGCHGGIWNASGVDCTKSNALCKPTAGTTKRYSCIVNPTPTPTGAPTPTPEADCGVARAGAQCLTSCTGGTPISGKCTATGTSCCLPAPTPTPGNTCTSGQERCINNVITSCGPNKQWDTVNTRNCASTGSTCVQQAAGVYNCVSVCQTSGAGTCRTAVSGSCPTGSSPVTGANSTGCTTGSLCCKPNTASTCNLCSDGSSPICKTSTTTCGGAGNLGCKTGTTLNSIKDSAGTLSTNCTAPTTSTACQNSVCANGTCPANKSCAGATATPTPTPGTLSCGEISGPNNAGTGSSNGVTITCDNADNATYAWTIITGSCGSISAGEATKNATWKAPTTAKTCKIQVDVTDGTTKVTKTKDIVVTSGATASPSPTASPNACTGTQVCYANAKQCSTSGVPQTCSTSTDPCGAWSNGTACTNGQTCTNGDCTGNNGQTILAFDLGLDGVGSAGDHQNPTGGGNPNPNTPQRPLTVEIYDSSNTLVDTEPTHIDYQTGSKRFTGNVTLKSGFTTGTYRVLVKSPRYLRKNVGGIVTITAGQTKQMAQANLTAGDIVDTGASANSLTIQDYSVLLSCSIFSPDNKGACGDNTNYATYADLNDNGTVDQDDYNLLLREWIVQNGD